MKRTGHLVSLDPTREAELLYSNGHGLWRSCFCYICTHYVCSSMFVDQAHGILLCATVLGKILIEPLFSHRGLDPIRSVSW